VPQPKKQRFEQNQSNVAANNPSARRHGKTDNQSRRAEGLEEAKDPFVLGSEQSGLPRPASQNQTQYAIMAYTADWKNCRCETRGFCDVFLDSAQHETDPALTK
jgi:hypothetical protein